MTLTESIFYGVIQGIAEFLPISSSGHLALAHNIFGTGGVDYVAFDVLLHLATLISVCVVYRKDVFLLVKGFFTLLGKLVTGKARKGLDYGEKLFVMLLIASLPLIPAAFLSDKVEALSSSTVLIGIFLCINGGVLFFADRISRKNTATIEASDYKKPFYVGLFQLFGVLPGISRSGSTITGGLVSGYERGQAVKFSFLLSIPAIIGAGIFKIPDLVESSSEAEVWLVYLAGAFVAAIVGFAAIKLLQYVSKKKGFGIFSVYCIFVGLAAIIYSIFF